MDVGKSMTNDALNYMTDLIDKLDTKVSERAFSKVNPSNGIVTEKEVREAFLEICQETVEEAGESQ